MNKLNRRSNPKSVFLEEERDYYDIGFFPQNGESAPRFLKYNVLYTGIISQMIL